MGSDNRLRAKTVLDMAAPAVMVAVESRGMVPLPTGMEGHRTMLSHNWKNSRRSPCVADIRTVLLETLVFLDGADGCYYIEPDESLNLIRAVLDLHRLINNQDDDDFPPRAESLDNATHNLYAIDGLDSWLRGLNDRTLHGTWWEEGRDDMVNAGSTSLRVCIQGAINHLDLILEGTK